MSGTMTWVGFDVHAPVTNLRPDGDFPERCNVVVDIGRVRRVLRSFGDPAASASATSPAGSARKLISERVNRSWAWRSPAGAEWLGAPEAA